jgi:large subunit ribosomal protein L25
MDFNSLKNVFYNIEFQALSAGEKIKVKVPVHYLNKDKIPAGLIFQELHHEVEMQVLPKNIIEYIEIDLLNMGHGDSQMLSDLDAYESDKFELLDASDTLMFTITESQVHLEQDPDLETVDAVDIPQIGDDE